MYYPEEIIEEIRTQNDIVEVVSEYVTLKKKGHSHFGLCPFHNEKTASFSVSEEKQMYYCFGCGAGGNVITFIMEKENYNFIETIKLLAEKRNISLPEVEYSEEAKKEIQKRQILLEIHKEAGRYFYYNLQHGQEEEAKEYLTKRQLSKDIQTKFGIGYAKGSHYDLYDYLKSKNYSTELILQSGLVIKSKHGKGYYDRFSDRLMFPIFDVQGRVIAFGGRVLDGSNPKYLNSPETSLFEKNLTLYSLNYARVSGKKEFFIVEGYMDVIAMYQAGIHNVVATLGTAFTIGHAKLIKKYVNEVVLLYDSDDAGIRATIRAIPILQSANIKVRVLHLPNKQDPDDYIMEKGVDSLIELGNNAVGSVTFQIKMIKLKYNIENVEQKIRFIEETSTLIAELKNAVEQEIYTQQVAKQYNIDPDALKTEVRKKMRSIQENQTNQTNRRDLSKQNIEINKDIGKHTKSQDGYFKTQSELLQLMCVHPNILKSVKEHLSPEDFIDPFFKVLVKLIYERQIDGHITNPSQFASCFETKEDQNKIANVFLAQRDYENNQIITKVINDTVKKIKIKSIEEKLKTTTDIGKLQNLLKEKKETDNLYIDCTSG
ncbi:MAG TPA: DNA primase [Epulopiscium sp.]|nr:DNA primase [Candidatus Epulonipiscium sp.]